MLFNLLFYLPPSSKQKCKYRKVLTPYEVECFNFITKNVSEQFEVEEKLLFEENRKDEIVIARHVCFWLANKLNIPPSKTQFYYQKKQHGTVIHGIKTVNNQRDYDADFNRVVSYLWSITKTLKKPPKKQLKVLFGND